MTYFIIKFLKRGQKMKRWWQSHPGQWSMRKKMWISWPLLVKPMGWPLGMGVGGASLCIIVCRAGGTLLWGGIHISWARLSFVNWFTHQGALLAISNMLYFHLQIWQCCKIILIFMVRVLWYEHAQLPLWKYDLVKLKTLLLFDTIIQFWKTYGKDQKIGRTDAQWCSIRHDL